MNINNSKTVVCVVAIMVCLSAAEPGTRAAAKTPVKKAAASATADWRPSGWGGGGYYWAAAFDPKRDGVIYMAGDVIGVYKTVDHGLHWRIVNKGLTDYGVYSLAVDRMHPQTVYAATEGGLYKSVDSCGHWVRLPHTGPKELRITGERGLSTRCIAVDPVHSSVVYAGSPGGKIFKSIDGGQNWTVSYSPSAPMDKPGSISSVAVGANNPAFVIAVSKTDGLLVSHDAGKSWTRSATPALATAAAIDPASSRVIYAGFGDAGVGRSVDRGVTWKISSQGLTKGLQFREIVVSPTRASDIYAIASAGWGGAFYASHDAGVTWTNSSAMSTDHLGDPTLPDEGNSPTLSAVTNLAMNPANPNELFISGNWRSCWSSNQGKTWTERVRGADISVVTDMRFSGNRTYASAMDEGTLMSENDGVQWSQLWPRKWSQPVSGHNWRIAVNQVNGVDRVISTLSPWDTYPPRTILSSDGGKSFKLVTDGLPDYLIHPNTMWGVGQPRALAVDPNNPIRCIWESTATRVTARVVAGYLDHRMAGLAGSSCRISQAADECFSV